MCTSVLIESRYNFLVIIIVTLYYCNYFSVFVNYTNSGPACITVASYLASHVHVQNPCLSRSAVFVTNGI